MKCRIESAFHFPQAGSGVQQSRATESMASSIDSTLSTSPNGASQELVSNDGSFSFAKMLKQGVSKPSSFAPETPKSSASLNVAPPKPRKNDDSEPEPEDYVPPPPKASLGDALAQAFEHAKSSGNSVAAPENSGGKKSSKKGKKNEGSKDFSHRICQAHYGLKLIEPTLNSSLTFTKHFLCFS